MPKHILHVVTNVAHYSDPAHPTGLWLSELTHAWEVFEARGFSQSLVSPAGGAVPLEPRSLKFPNYDKSAKAWHADPRRMALLETTASPDQIDAAEQLAVDRGARYEKAVLPFVSNVVVDGRLVTGQNPGSAKATAEAVAAVLS
ncbi:hypothetical protein [Gordonia iterans]